MTAPQWFQIYFFDHGKNRRYYCQGPGAWRQADRCGSMTFRKIGGTDIEDTVVCTQGHEQTVLKGYSTERRQTDEGLF